MDSTNGNALRSDNIYMNVDPNPAYISLKPDNNTAQIILSDGSNTDSRYVSDKINIVYTSGVVENKEDIAVSSTAVVDTISTTDGTSYQNSAITTCSNSGVGEVMTATNLSTTNFGSATINCQSTLVVMGVGCVSPGSPANVDGAITLQATTTNPLLSISQSQPFSPSYSTILDKNGINQNNSSGAGFTIQSAQAITLSSATNINLNPLNPTGQVLINGNPIVTSITAGNNISVDNTIPTAPIVAVRSPLNNTLNIGSQNVSGGLSLATPNSVWNYQGLNFFTGGPGGGSVEGQYLPNSISLTTPLTNSGSVSISPTNMLIQGPSTSTLTSTTVTPTLTTIKSDNGISGEVSQTTISPQNITTSYVNGPSPTLTTTALTNLTTTGIQHQLNYVDATGASTNTANQVSTTTAFSKVAYSSNTIAGEKAEEITTAQSNQVDTSVEVVNIGSGTSTRTDITIGGAILDTHTSTNGDGTIPATITATKTARVGTGLGTTTLQRLQDATTDTYTKVYSEFQSGSAVSYLQAIREETGVQSTGVGMTANTTQGEISLNHTDIPSGRIQQASIITTNGSSTLNLQTTGAGPSTGTISLAPGFAGTDATLNFNAVGSLANLAITTNRNIAFNSLNITSTPTNFRVANTDVGGALNPLLTLLNTNAGNNSVYMEVYKDKGSAGSSGDTLFQQSVWGKDGANNKQEYTRITHTIRANTSGVEEGSIEMGTFADGGYSNFIQINGNDIPSGEVNVLRPIDLSTGSAGLIKTSGTGSVDLTLDATTSAGAGGVVLKTKNATGSIAISGNQITTTATPGANSGRFLRIFLPDAAGVLTPYKIALLNDT
jgi:hypothetical protein